MLGMPQCRKKGRKSMMCFKKALFLLFIFLTLLLSCQQAKEPGNPNQKIKVIATTFPVYDFARNIGGDKIEITMLLPPGTDAHHYELRPEDIMKVCKSDIFLFTNFEMEQWAYKIISAADKNTNTMAVETGSGAFLLPLNKEAVHENHASGFDPHIWLDMDNAQKMVDNITAAFIKKDSRNSDFYTKNATDYKLKLAEMDKKFRTELSGCKTRTVLHAGHWAFAYLAQKYNLQYIAASNVFADGEPSPQQIFNLIEQIKSEKTHYVFYENMINPRLAQTMAKETGAGLLRLSNGQDISKADIHKGESFLSIMEKNLFNLKKGLQCPKK